MHRGRVTATTRARVDRQTVDLSAYPVLVVVYLGMRVKALTGVTTVLGPGPQIGKAAAAKPDGVLLRENLIFLPRQNGLRQYWRDSDALEAWTRSDPHRRWWKNFVRDSGGTGFWHESYFARGGMEAIYDDMPVPVGFARFAPLTPARGGLFSARRRAGLAGEPMAAPVAEG